MMFSAPPDYDQKAFQDLLNRVRAIEERFSMPLDKITLRASDDSRVLKDITVNDANTITAAAAS